jgi:hypothetical protein
VTEKSQILSAEFLRSGMSRRRLLAGAGAVGAALVAAACGSDEDTSSNTTGSTSASTTAGTTPATQASTPATEATTADTMGGTTPDTAAEGSGDLGIAQLAAGLEVLAVNTSKGALDAAGSGALGEVPPAVAEFVTTAMAHHEAHRDAWNDIITGAGGKAVTEPNADLAPVVAEEFGKVKDVGGAAKLALMLEQIASATYLEALPMIQDKDAIELAGSIQIIDMQHQSILLFALGEYPVPDTFAPVEKSAA